MLTTEAALNPGRPLFVCTGPIAALWVNVDENACAARCSSAVNAAWPIDAILCCESRARECRVRLGVGKGAADINTVARDGITGAQVAQWPRSGAVECATLSAFALTGIALTYPRYVANTTIGNTSYANEDTYAGGPFPRAAAVELLGETAMASAEARCLTSVSPRCCRPNYGARGAPSQFGYELLVDSVVLPSNATCLPPTIYWQDNWGTNFACAPDAVVLATPTLGGPECLNFCRQHQTDAPFLELCCSIRATSDCMLAVGGRIPVSLSLGSYAFVGITTRYLDVTGDNCVNNEDLLCAAQTATMPSRVPLCPSTNFDRVMAECCRDEGMRSPAHVWAAFNGSTPSTRCATNGCVAFANENRLCRYASSPLAVWNATNSGACLALCRAAQFGNGTLNASPQLCCQFTSSNGLCTLTLGDVDSGPGGVTPSSGDRATTCIAPSAQRAAYNESCVSLNSVPCLITHASWGVPTRPVCAPLPLPTACCAVADGTLAPGDIDGDGDVTPNDVAMVARGAYATLPAPLIAAGPQCAALRNDTALVCGAVVTNATCTGSVVDSINSTVHGDATCRAWCESRRPPPTMPLTRYCCQSRAPGGSACTLIAAVQLPVAMLVASASAVSVCVHRALMAAAPEVPRVPVLVPSTWNSMVALPSGVGTPGCLGNADLACAAGRLAKRNDAYNCAEPSSPTPGATLPPGVSDTGSTSSSSGGGISGTAAINASTDANALVTTTITATDALVGPLIGVGVGALVLGILIGLLACFLINRKRNAAAAPASAAVVNSGSDRPNPRRESMYATVPRKAGGTEMAYIDLPAEQEATTAREAESEDDKNDIYNKMPVEYTAFPNP